MAPKRPNILAVILGGGAGTRLSPLTLTRSKPAVPLGGKYRLVDIPISNCINSDVLRIFVLTQYNSASLNKHIATTYRFSQFSNGFVEILAAEQTPQNPQWFQGTADAVRQVLPHIGDWGIDTLLILSGDHLYRMDYRKFLARHFESDADVTVSVIPFFGPGFRDAHVAFTGGLVPGIRRGLGDLSSQQLQNLTAMSWQGIEVVAAGGGTIEKFVFIQRGDQLFSPGFGERLRKTIKNIEGVEVVGFEVKEEGEGKRATPAGQQ